VRLEWCRSVLRGKTSDHRLQNFFGHDRSQLLLLPQVVDDYVGPDNPVRFIDAFVGRLDLAAASFSRVEPKVTGRPGYAPADLLKFYIYGYLNRVRSSRRLEAETHRNIEVIWLLRHLKPNFKTIADFRRDNRSGFRQVFREFVLLCRQLTCLAGSCSCGWHADQGGQQQGSQFHAGVSDPVYQSR
jgi:transposase